MRPALAARLPGSVLLALCLTVSSCAVSAPPFVVALPNGYYLKRNKSLDPDIVRRSGGTVLRGPVAAYAVHRHIVAGCVGHWPPRAFAYPNETPFPESAEARYFVLDTTSGKLEADLDRMAWKERLEELGAPASLKITAPILPG
jgi:hypothetical protein